MPRKSSANKNRLDENEKELRALTDAVIAKLRKMTDAAMTASI